MSAERNPLDALSLLAGWALSNGVGWGVGLSLGALLTMATLPIPGLNEDRFFTYATLVALGLATGVAQWLVMKRYLPQPARWVLATLVGYALCTLVVAGANRAQLAGTGPWDDALLIGLVGAVIGLSQWWILRRSYRQAWLQAVIWWNDGRGAYRRPDQPFRYSKRHGLAIGDFDGDGWPDIFAGRYSEDFRIWFNHRDGTFACQASS